MNNVDEYKTKFEQLRDSLKRQRRQMQVLFETQNQLVVTQRAMIAEQQASATLRETLLVEQKASVSSHSALITSLQANAALREELIISLQSNAELRQELSALQPNAHKRKRGNSVPSKK